MKLIRTEKIFSSCGKALTLKKEKKKGIKVNVNKLSMKIKHS